MSYKVNSVSELAVKVAQDPELAAQMKQDPAKTLATVAAPLQTDVWIYRIVVSALALTVIFAILGAIIITLQSTKIIPDVLVALGSAAVGAVAGLLAPSPAAKS